MARQRQRERATHFSDIFQEKALSQFFAVVPAPPGWPAAAGHDSVI
jgi:hypothetical protein